MFKHHATKGRCTFSEDLYILFRVSLARLPRPTLNSLTSCLSPEVAETTRLCVQATDFFLMSSITVEMIGTVFLVQGKLALCTVAYSGKFIKVYFF